jgi:hypothetical protein
LALSHRQGHQHLLALLGQLGLSVQQRPEYPVGLWGLLDLLGLSDQPEQRLILCLCATLQQRHHTPEQYLIL